MSAISRTLPHITPANSALLLVSTAHALNHAYAILMPLAYTFVAREIPLTNTDIGVMTGVGGAISGILQLAFSYLSFYIARRVLLGGGQFVIGLATLLTGAAHSYTPFFLGNMLARLGGSPQHPVGSSILADRYGEKGRGFALSMHVAGGNVGTVAVPLVGTFLLTTLGWRNTLFLYAACVIAMGVAILLFVNDAKRHVNEGGRAEIKLRDTPREIGRILANRNILFILLATTIAAGGRGLGTLTAFVPRYFDALKIDQETIALLYTTMLLGSVIGPIILGRISDQRGRKPVLLATYAAATIITFIFVALGANIAPLFLLIFMLGTTYSESPLLVTFLMDSSINVDRDLALGVYFTVAFGVGSIWGAILGTVIDTFGFGVGFAVMAASYVGAALLILPTKEQRLKIED